MAGWNGFEDESTGPSSPASGPAIIPGRKFQDDGSEEQVLEDWEEAAEQSEVELDPSGKAEVTKIEIKSDVEANHMPKTQRIEALKEERLKTVQSQNDLNLGDKEDETEKRKRLLQSEKDSDLKHAEQLFGVSHASNNTAMALSGDSSSVSDLSSLAIFNPRKKEQFDDLRETLIKLITRSAKERHYAKFLLSLTEQMAKTLPSSDIKKISTSLTNMSIEKVKQERAAEAQKKKTKAGKTKVALAGNSKTIKADITNYDLDDDFM